MAVACEAITPFPELWRQVRTVTGWLSEPEAGVLWQAALATPADGVIVEIGSFAGKSARVLAAAGRRLLCVDRLTMGLSVGKIVIDDAIVASLQAVVNDHPHVTWQHCESQDADYPPRIDMVYIDACHKYPYPLNDYLAVRHALHPGSQVAFHDYHREHGVTRTVLELESHNRIRRTGGAETLYLGMVL